MNCSITVDTHISADQWQTYVADSPRATFYHQHAWSRLVADVYGGEVHCVAATDDGEIRGILPAVLRRVIGDGRVLISVPMADEGGIVAEDDLAESALLEGACELTDEVGAAHLELRQREPLPDMQTDLTRVTMEMTLPDDPDVLWDGFKGKVRNQVRKAQKSGLSALRADDLHSAISHAFYPVYCENTRDLGSPMHSERFFHEVVERFPDASDIVVVSEGDTVVGAGFALRWRARIMVPWASSLRRYFSMCPNNLLYWELMRLAIEKGCTVFDFGRSPKDSGTYRFKEQWGAEPVQLYYCYYSRAGDVDTSEKRESTAYRIFSSVWQRTPMPIARAIGPRIWARLPI